MRDVAERLDIACGQECDKDLMCHPEDALPADECFESFCDYTNFVEIIEPDEGFVSCMEAHLVVLNCLLPLTCQAYSAYYGDTPGSYPCEAEDEAWAVACAEFEEDTGEGME